MQICLFVFDRIYERDRQTDTHTDTQTPHDGIGAAKRRVFLLFFRYIYKLSLSLSLFSQFHDFLFDETNQPIGTWRG